MTTNTMQPPDIEAVVETLIEDIVAQMHLWQENERTVREFSQNLRSEITDTITTLTTASEARGREEAYKEAGNFVGELYQSGNMGDNEYDLLTEFFDEKLNVTTKHTININNKDV